MTHSLTDFTEGDLTYQLRLNLVQREIVIDQLGKMDRIFNDKVALYANAEFQTYQRDLDILERFITQLENALEIVARQQTLISN